MSSVTRNRWAVAIAALLAVAIVGFGWPPPSPAREGRAAAGSGGIEVGWTGWWGAEAVIPVQRKVDAASRPERDVRLKPVPFLLAVTAALSALGAARCAGRHPPRATPLPLALRSRSVLLRAPPLLLLG